MATSARFEKVALATLIMAFSVGKADAALFTAYNDFASPFASSGNVTNITSSGTLKNYADGASTGVSLTVGGGIFITDGGGVPASSGLAGSLFGAATVPNLNETGRYYGTASRAITLTFSGLSSGTYDLALYVGDYPAGYSEAFLISDLSSFTNTSSSYVTKSTVVASNDKSTYAGKGSDGDSAIRYSMINPGSDGDFTVSITALTSGIPWGIISALRLEQVAAQAPEPATLGLLAAALAGLLGARRKAKNI